MEKMELSGFVRFLVVHIIVGLFLGLSRRMTRNRVLSFYFFFLVSVFVFC